MIYPASSQPTASKHIMHPHAEDALRSAVTVVGGVEDELIIACDEGVFAQAPRVVDFPDAFGSIGDLPCQVQ